MKPLVPSESYEGEQFALWLEANNYVFSHLAQNTFTRSWSVKAKLKRAGVKKGIPDYLLVLKNGGILFVELKRIKGGRLSPEQKTWLAALANPAGRYFAAVAFGAEEAQKQVLLHEKILLKKDVVVG